MTVEVLRVDPASQVPVGEDWVGYHLRTEQRHPVHGDGYQLWAIDRATEKPNSAILQGMPVSPAFGTIDDFVLWLRAPEQEGRAGGVLSLADAYIFADLVQVAQNSTVVDGTWVRGIRGAVAGFRWWRDRLRAEGKV